MIAVDWGTSSLRLYRMADDGQVRERRRSDQGVMACAGRFGEVLAREIVGWDDTDVLLCGMVGGRGGWHEMPYLPCPAGNHALAMGMQRFLPPGFEDRALWLVPGLRDSGSDAVPDVMRGEETQLAALLDVLPGGAHQVCLPGTHSKWVTVRDGQVQRIATAMTGELYALLRQHGTLGQLMPAGETRFDGYAFDAGIKRSADTGGLLHHLFGVRAAGLFQQFAEAALPSYLSGLLIGHELRASGLLSHAPRPAQVHLIGNDRLLTSYAHALTSLGVGVQRHPEDLAARGLHALWMRRAMATATT
ncbi:2-dehydro-3-deoxygalactonokinase [Marilutibacter chinensis]|uniref:2-dehydro-3-deoxygalactonokinase n=1 Tax=Marilutibacter chinensis TaxID=2912247 RepID=A0ABS9HR88_9GAMM|nr:2-dehydro-3-deoxygalactonokinase [Lysobacter chinensis]MCF7220827.1 2-dehydro-3-deoxygalactonokinase [Lysobacter chinensis]